MIFIVRRFVCIWIGAFITPPIDVRAQLPDISFEHYTTDQGLSSDYVTAILKDRRGFMWFGTSNGLNRFDGLRFKVYKHSRQIKAGQSDGLIGNYIVNNGITEDKDGFLWISTNRGLFRFDPIQERFTLISIPPLTDQSGDNDYVSPLRFDQQGNGWFSSKYQLYRLNPQTLRLTSFPIPTLTDNAYSDPFFDSQGRFWIQHAGAVYRFNPKTRKYTYYLGNDNRHPTSTYNLAELYESPEHQLYLTSYSHGLLAYDSVSDQFRDIPDPSPQLLSILEDRQANGKPLLWMGGSANKLMAYLPAEKRSVTFTRILDDALSYQGGAVLVFYRDRQSGILWIGTTHGIEKIDPHSIKFKRKLLVLPYNNPVTGFISSISQDIHDNNLYWLAGRDIGLYRWNRQTGEVISIPFSKNITSKPDAIDLTQDKLGRIWIGMRQGVSRYDPTTNTWQHFTTFLPTHTRSSYSIDALCTDHQGRVWLGSGLDGLYWYAPATNSFHTWPLQQPKAAKVGVSRIEEDKRGRLWVLTDKGLYCLNPETGTTRHITLKTSDVSVKPSDQLQSTFNLDHQGRIWMSGIGFVVCADTTGKVLKTYTIANGLQADHTFAITEDQRGYIWMITDNYLHELDPATGHFRYYDKGSGLFSKAIFMSAQLHLNRAGELFIGFAGAFNYVQPKHLRPNPNHSPAVLTEIRVNNQLRRPKAGPIIQLRPGETTLSVDFIAPNYSQPEKNHYAYQLVGFDHDWIETDAHSATYTNLEPGHYTLQIRAANSDGLWNKSATELHIRVIPAFYQTFWFKLLCVLAGIGILYAIYRYRLTQQHRVEVIRNRIAKDLHDDMGSTLSSIRIFSDVLQQQLASVKPEAIPILQRISSSATTLSESMQDIIWTIRTNHDTLNDVVTRMREFGLKMAEAKGIVFQMQVSDEFQTIRLDLAQRRNLYLIVKESVNNAVKYANCTQIDVLLTGVNKQLRLVIQDNGTGFDPSLVRQGNGLQNLHQRATEINGQCILTTAPGQGTTVDVRVKL